MKKRLCIPALRAIAALAATATLAAPGCTDLRDLYDTSRSVLDIEGSWVVSLDEATMHNATVLTYRNGEEVRKEYLSRPNGATVSVSRGDYDVLIFNGIMESEQITNLDHVFFRGTDHPSTFEACAAEVSPIRRLSRTEDEYIASNEMELFTFDHHTATVEEESFHYIKYDNGKNVEGGHGDHHGHITGTIESAPKAMSFFFRVRMTTIRNPLSARSAAGALRGFLGSAYMPASGGRPRPGFDATHHLTLTQPNGSRTRTEGDGTEYGALVTPKFVTFGPPMPQMQGEALPDSGRYFFEPVFVLLDGTEFKPGTYDVTQQVNRAIRRIADHHDGIDEISLEENDFEIVIDEEIILPYMVSEDGGGPGVDVGPWEDVEIIIVWVRK